MNAEEQLEPPLMAGLRRRSDSFWLASAEVRLLAAAAAAAAGLFLLMLSSYRANGDLGLDAVSVCGFSCFLQGFLVTSCSRLGSLRQLSHDPRRPELAARKWPWPVWVLPTLLTVVFCFKVAVISPVTVDTLVFGMAATVMLGSLYTFSVHMQEKDDDATFFFNYATRFKDAVVVFSLGVASTIPVLLTRCFTASLTVRRRHLPRRVLGETPAPHQDLQGVPRPGPLVILDSGATRHAVGDRRLLVGFRPYDPPFVAVLADGRRLSIVGTGSIETERFRIPGVDLVDGLQDVLISIPQLDTEHGLLFAIGNRTCRIMQADRARTVVGAAFLDANGLYIARYLVVPG